MTADDVRARFEALALREGFALDRADDGEYHGLSARYAWRGFQMAHADLSGEVRELVEADREYDAAVEAVLTHKFDDLDVVQERMANAAERRSAAIAKFTHQEKP